MAVSADRTYDYILQLLGFDRLAYPDHPVIEALKDVSYTSYPSLFQLRRDDVEALTFTDYNVYPPVRRHLPMGHQTILLVPLGYRIYFQSTHQRHMSQQDWMRVTVEEIQDYMMSDAYMHYNNSEAFTTFSHIPPIALKKSTRRDPNMFKLLEDDQDWTHWYLHFVATAQAQNLQDILNPNYTPFGRVNAVTYKADQEYLSSVLTDILLTDAGKALLRNKYLSGDAQTIFMQLCAHYSKRKPVNVITTIVRQDEHCCQEFPEPNRIGVSVNQVPCPTDNAELLAMMTKQYPTSDVQQPSQLCALGDDLSMSIQCTTQTTVDPNLTARGVIPSKTDATIDSVIDGTSLENDLPSSLSTPLHPPLSLVPPP